jgi:Arc/MetJ-type ribon-helix-helix transcriptional regulator
MNISISLPEEDVAFVDAYAQSHRADGVTSRSAALQRAVELLREAESESAYAEAFTEWDQSPDKPLWDSAAGDGLGDAPR